MYLRFSLLPVNSSLNIKNGNIWTHPQSFSKLFAKTSPPTLLPFPLDTGWTLFSSQHFFLPTALSARCLFLATVYSWNPSDCIWWGNRQLSLSFLSIITAPPSSSPFLHQTACRDLSSYSISTLWVIFKPCGVTAFFFIVNCLSSSLLTFSQSIVWAANNT